MVILPGYEWSGNTPAGGDHNVYFLEDNPPILRSSHWQVPQVLEDEVSPAHPINVLFERLKSLSGFHCFVTWGKRFSSFGSVWGCLEVRLLSMRTCKAKSDEIMEE